jgi:drug/metabolite transporter (DMT)-like permease
MWVLSTLDASGKWLLSAGVPLITVVWMRYLSHLLLMSCLILPRHGVRILGSKAWHFQFLRAALMLLASLCLFGALLYLPQAQTTAIAFLAPLLMLALAPWLLSEPQKKSRWIAAAAGFIGVLIVIRPDAGLNSMGVLFALGAAISLALQHVYTRRLAVDHPMTTLFWSGMFGTVVMSIIMGSEISLHMNVLAELSGFQWVIMVSLGLTGGIGQLLQIQAYQQAPASLLAPFIYLQITSATALGWLIWGEFPDRLTWVGIGIICFSGVAITIYEWQTRRQQSLSS